MNNRNLKTKRFLRWIVLVLLVLSGLWFQILEDKILIPEYLMHTRMDDYIPFVPLFVIPYVLWYFYVALPGLFLFLKAPDEFVKYAAFLALGMFIACSVYTLFPNGQALRPALRGELDSLSRLLLDIYMVDTPTNSAPSIHVIYSIAAMAAIRRYNNTRRKIAWVNAASLVLSCLCILSTVFVKQHSVIDLLTGLAVSALLWLVFYGIEEFRTLREKSVNNSTIR